jgi:putative flippase GtrA
MVVEVVSPADRGRCQGLGASLRQFTGGFQALLNTPLDDGGVETFTALLERSTTAPGEGPVLVEIVVPVLDEVASLEQSVRRLHGFLTAEFPFTARITIADNGSRDGTWDVASTLAVELPRVRAVRLAEKGRGRALQAIWSRSDAAVLAYMDVDLSTDLGALLPLVAPLLSGHSDLAIGSRLTRGARVVRGPRRELISRAYNAILHVALGTRFSDAQCGFKAIRADRARELLPHVRDRSWFFDTELLVLAEQAGMRIHEVPVDWVDDPDSRVDIVRTAGADLRGTWRLMRDLAAGRIPVARTAASRHAHGFGGQVLRFALIGIASTLAYLALYVALRGTAGAQAANFVALLSTAVGNTWANRRLTFGIRGRARSLRHQAQGLIVFGLALCLTSGSLALLSGVAPAASHGVEVAVLVVANLAATVLRFVLLRGWVFRAQRAEPPTAAAPAAVEPIAEVVG